MIYIARHGETIYNKEKKFTGKSEVSLTKKGEEFSRALGKYFKGKDIEVLYSSPLSRSLFLAEEISKTTKMEVQVKKDLTEMRLGVIEGKTKEEVKKDFPNLNFQKIERFPQGESYKELRRRAENFVKEMDLNKNTIICGHALINGMIRSVLTGRNFKDQPGQPNNRVYKISRGNKTSETFETFLKS